MKRFLVKKYSSISANITWISRQILHFTAFYLGKQKSFNPKKIWSVPNLQDSSLWNQQMAPWRPNFPKPRLWDQQHHCNYNICPILFSFIFFFFHFQILSNRSNCHCGHICHTHFPLEPIAQWLDLCHTGRKLSFYCSTNGLSDRLNGFHL